MTLIRKHPSLVWPLCILFLRGPDPCLTAVRSRLLLIPDPRDERQTLLLTVKHSLCPQQPGALLYQVHTNEQDQPVIHWLGPYPASLLTRLPTTPIRSPSDTESAG